MKNGFSLSLILFFLLAGCNTGENWEVKFTKPLQYIKGAESPFEIKVTEENKPVIDLNATAHMEMTTMSHGSINLKLEEGKNGVYRGNALLPMAGKYTVTFTFKKEGYRIEKILEVDVQKEKKTTQKP